MLKHLEVHTRPFDLDDVVVSTVKETKEAVFRCTPYDKKAIVAGRGSRIETEVKIENAIEDDIPILTRIGGGCSVFLDPGNLIVSAAFPAEGFLNIGPLFHHTVIWLCNGLKAIGIANLYPDGISDLVIDNRKVGGTCFYRTKGVAYFSASLLVNADLDLIDRYLEFPPRQPEYRQNRPHLDFVSNLNAFDNQLSPQRLSEHLSAVLDPEILVSLSPSE